MAKKSKKKSGAPAAPTTRKPQGKQAWKLFDRGSTVVAGLLAARVASVTWKAATGKQAPTSTRDPEVSTREALTFAVVTGALIQLTKVYISRKTVDYWVKSTGELPPPLQKKAPHTEKGATKAPSVGDAS